MRVIAFFGSPRKDGNTSILLKEAIRGVEESGHKVQVFKLAQHEDPPLPQLRRVRRDRGCVIEDDEMPRSTPRYARSTGSSSPARSSSPGSRRRPRR